HHPVGRLIVIGEDGSGQRQPLARHQVKPALGLLWRVRAGCDASGDRRRRRDGVLARGHDHEGRGNDQAKRVETAHNQTSGISVSLNPFAFRLASRPAFSTDFTKASSGSITFFSSSSGSAPSRVTLSSFL